MSAAIGGVRPAGTASSSTGREDRYANTSPRSIEEHRNRRMKMNMIVLDLARDRIRQVQRDAEQARQVRRMRSRRDAGSSRRSH
jgi:hypothetical protein